ncbi:MAG: VWA domain-containing protein [Candidatus Norongarragalinales archaeon]
MDASPYSRIAALSRLRVVDVRREPAVAALFDSGTLSDADLNKTLIEVIGSFWAVNNSGNASVAANLSAAVFAPFFPASVNWALLYEGEPVYNSSALPSTGFAASSRKLVSGIAKSLPQTGCVASAYLQKIGGKNDASYYYFGGFVGQGNITAVMRGIPSDANASLIFFELSAGDNFTLYANGVNCGSFNVSNAANYSIINASVTAPACLNAVVGGAENNFTIAFNGSDLSRQFIGGGFLKVVYSTTGFATQRSTQLRYYLPGIDGLINYYSSFFVPGSVSNVSARLHFFNNYTTNFTIGNRTVFNSSGSDADQIVLLSDSNFTPLFNYSTDLSQKNVPIKFWAYANVTGGAGYADVILITDTSGSMAYAMNSSAYGVKRVCTDERIYDNDTARISVAKCVDKQFVEAILSGQGNRVGLVAFNSNANDYYALSTDINALESEIDSYDASGGTCICCAINRAFELLNTTFVTQLIPSRSAWSYNASFPTAIPLPDAQGNNWTNRSYNVSWQNASAPLGFGTGVATNIGSNFVVESSAEYNASAFMNASGNHAGGTLSDTFDVGGGSLNFSEYVVLPAAQQWIGSSEQGSHDEDGGYTRFMNASTTTGDDYAVPTGFTTITHFRYNFGNRGGQAGTIKFKVFRGSGEPNRFDVVFSSGAYSVTRGSLQTIALPTPAQVQGGDRIGFYTTQKQNHMRPGTGGDARYYASGDLTGSNLLFTPATGYYYSISALANRPARYALDVRFNSSEVSIANASLINATLRFRANASAFYSLLIYDYDSSTWNSTWCASGVVAAGAWNDYSCIVSENASRFFSPDGKISLALNRSLSETQVETQVDFVRFTVLRGRGDYFFRKAFYVANASLLLNASLTVFSDDAADVYLNGVLIDSDSEDHEAQYWNRLIQLNTSLFVQGWNIVAVQLKNNDNASAKFDAEINASWHRDRYIIVMSDGIAGYRCTSTSSCSPYNAQCGYYSRCFAGNASTGSQCCGGQDPDDCNNAACNAASLNANYSACRARRELNATVHSVGFGLVYSCSLANSTLRAVAQCGNGSYYASSNASQLADFYRNLASAIVRDSTTQEAYVTGEISSTLYPDSWLDFVFEPATPQYGYQELSVDLETPKFPSCQGNFSIPSAMRVDEFRVSSYSGEYWTDNASLLNSGTNGWMPFFNLSVYNPVYRFLGDPFVLWANASTLRSGETNFVSIRTGNSTSTPNPNCSAWNQGFFKARVSAAVNYSNVFLYCKARNASIYYDLNYDGVADGAINVTVGGFGLPSASEEFVPPENFSSDNAVDDALQRLLNNLDFVATGSGPSGSQFNPIGIKLSDSVGSQILTGEGIPFAWGPIEATIVVWPKQGA